MIQYNVRFDINFDKWINKCSLIRLKEVDSNSFNLDYSIRRNETSYHLSFYFVTYLHNHIPILIYTVLWIKEYFSLSSFNKFLKKIDIWHLFDRLWKKAHKGKDNEINVLPCNLIKAKCIIWRLLSLLCWFI